MGKKDVFAQRVVDNYIGLSGNREAAIDPAFIQLVIMLIETLVPLIQDCIAKRQAKVAASNPTLLQRILVNQKVRQTLSSPRAFRQYGRDMADAVFKTAAESTEDELKEVYDEVQLS